MTDSLNNKSYFRFIANHFYSLPLEAVDPEVLRQVKRSLLNYLAGSIYTAANGYSSGMVSFIKGLNPIEGNATIWRDPSSVTPAIAAAANAARLSSIELNDGTRSSAHPGIYVWSSLLATYQSAPQPISKMILAAVFGYEVCTRMAMLTIDRIRELGLHNPGFVGGLGAVSAAGFLNGMTLDQLVNAFGIVASLTPLCPFVSFVEGSDVKDLYGGWGTYLAMLAVKGGLQGLTGPEGVLDGVKSLDKIFQGNTGKDIAIGSPYFITSLSLKEFPACFAVNPAIKAALKLHDQNVLTENIKEVKVWSYPYSYDLDQGLPKQINQTSARLSLKHSVAVALLFGKVTPMDFEKKVIQEKQIEQFKEKIQIFRYDILGDGPTATRACRVEILMTDGTLLTSEHNASDTKPIVSDEELTQRLKIMTKGVLSDQQADFTNQFVMNLEKQSDLAPLLNVLNGQ